MAKAITLAKIPTSWKKELEISSAGTYGGEGQPASSLAVAVLKEAGVDLSDHQARRLTKEMIENSDLVVVMEGEHRDAVLQMAPEAASRVIILGELEEGRKDPDIDDPIGGNREVYKRTRDEIDRLVVLLIDHLADKYGLKK